MHVAAINGNCDAVRAIVRIAPATVHILDAKRWPPLLYADFGREVFRRRDEDVVLALLEADVKQIAVLGRLLERNDESCSRLAKNILTSLTTVAPYFGSILSLSLCVIFFLLFT